MNVVWLLSRLVLIRTVFLLPAAASLPVPPTHTKIGLQHRSSFVYRRGIKVEASTEPMSSREGTSVCGYPLLLRLPTAQTSHTSDCPLQTLTVVNQS